MVFYEENLTNVTSHENYELWIVQNRFWNQL